MATESHSKLQDKETQDDSTLNLPAPLGWTKKVSLGKGGTPKRGAVVFISADGTEIKHKKALEKYLKTHDGNPPLSEFDWGTGDTPRRSSRLKTKATESPENEPATKRKASSSSKKGKAKDTIQSGEAPSPNEEGKDDDSKVDAEMKDAEPVELKDNITTAATEEVVTAAAETNEEHTVTEDQIMEDPCVVEGANVESNSTIASTVEINKDSEVVPPVKEDDNKVPEEEVSVEVPKAIEENSPVKEAALQDNTQSDDVKPVDESLPDSTQTEYVKPVEILPEDSTQTEDVKPVEASLPKDTTHAEDVKPVEASIPEDTIQANDVKPVESLPEDTIQANDVKPVESLPLPEDTIQAKDVKPVEASVPEDTIQAKDVKPVGESLPVDATPAETMNNLNGSNPVEENLPVDNPTESKPVVESLQEDSKPKVFEAQPQSSTVSS